MHLAHDIPTNALGSHLAAPPVLPLTNMAATLRPLLAALALLAGPVLAHGGLGNYTVGDTWYRGYDPSEPASEQVGQPWMVQRQWVTIDPIFTVDSPYLACNTPGAPPPANSYIPISAGDNLTAVYWYWLHPVGPMTVWLAACGDDCTTVDVNKLDFFKIWEAGLLEGPNLAEGVWYQKEFQRWDGSPGLWPVRIPRNLRAGRYIVRHEILSIHIEDKPQFYPQCAHLEVKGEGDAVPGEEWLRRFPGAYEADDPSIRINIYAKEFDTTTNYTIPGGPIWDG
ncbi:glycoside hydrolase family 61 protein [Cercophora newfieldiana]|uniref:lytic cellulose monooxygenase (C4-dehydrogenating) n=1 Tax=Cercophora newfieldiana TaxID=92897 RepID=A0AA40CRX1_9PEZI|nr:glycoside hydrolase family 61 protein [Cercophora newfieldiana]